MKFCDRLTKRPVEWEYRLFLDGNTYPRYITCGYATRCDALVNAKIHARRLLYTGQAFGVEYCVDKMWSSRIPSPFSLSGYLSYSIRG